MTLARWAAGRGPEGDVLRVLGRLSDGLIAVEVVSGDWMHMPYSVLPSDIELIDNVARFAG